MGRREEGRIRDVLVSSSSVFLTDIYEAIKGCGGMRHENEGSRYEESYI